MTPIWAGDWAAICNLGSDWETIWSRLLAGEHDFVDFSQSGMPIAVPAQVGMVSGLDRTLLPGPYAGAGAACRLIATVVRRVFARGTSASQEVHFFGASNHGESDVMLVLARSEHAGETSRNEGELWCALLTDPLAEHALHLGGIDQEVPLWVYSACTSGLHAVILACLELIVDGDARQEACVVAGDALSAIGVAGFHRVGAISRRGCTPFQRGLDGIVVSEGAAAIRLTLTKGEHFPQVAIVGAGMSCDAAHPTLPAQDGGYLEQAIRKALEDASTSPQAVGAVVAHGTGTQANDLSEAAAIRRVFGDRALPVTSLKHSIGHTMGAAGVFNLLAGAEALRSGLLPPTAVTEAEPIEGIDLVFGSPRTIDQHLDVLITCSGFGGNNVAVVLRRVHA